MNDKELDEYVSECLDNALENDYDFKGWTDEAVMEDLCDCSDVLDRGVSEEDILASVKRVRK